MTFQGCPGKAEEVIDRFGPRRQVQAVNVESALLLTRAFVPGMRERGFSRVIFIVSDSYWRPPGAHMLA
jgi:NAD(P)-dependent dehydrogenase (short-subunit alcohol dehydrogenase family)